MKNTIQVQDMTFEQILSPSEIAASVQRVADAINRDYAGREPLFVCVLNGAFMFAADLFRKIRLHSKISFVKLQSYEGTSSTGQVRELFPVQEDVRGKDIIVIEDIVDTGTSMHFYKQHLMEQGANSVRVACFVHKPRALKFPDARPEYIGVEIPKLFIVGYGLDLDSYERNYDAIYQLQSPYSEA